MKNILKRLERLLFFAVILFLPTQFGKHFWPAFSFIDGIRIDYLSPTLYLTDFLIILLFVTFISRLMLSHKVKISNQFKNAKFFTFFVRKRQALLIGLLVVLVFIGSILFSHSPMAGIYKLLKLIEFGFVAFYIATQVDIKKSYSTMLMIFALGIIFESFIAVWQFFKQASVGGALWFLGERTFSGQTPGIANAIIDGRLVLRPYGTFPHPNVLAGYLTIAMTMVISNIKYQISNMRKILLFVCIAIGTVGLVLTLSRGAIVLWIILVFWFSSFLIGKTKRKKLFAFRFSLFAFLIVGSIFFTPLSWRFTSLLDVDSQSYLRRQELNTAALTMLRDSPVFGVGLNNFLVRLPDYQKPTAGSLWMQPVHNIYLLVLAETGIIGFLCFMWFVSKTFIRIIRRPSFFIFASVIVLGLFDHYFFTLQQGQLLFALVLGFVWSKRV